MDQKQSHIQHLRTKHKKLKLTYFQPGCHFGLWPFRTPDKLWQQRLNHPAGQSDKVNTACFLRPNQAGEYSLVVQVQKIVNNRDGLIIRCNIEQYSNYQYTFDCD